MHEGRRGRTYKYIRTARPINGHPHNFNPDQPHPPPPAPSLPEREPDIVPDGPEFVCEVQPGVCPSEDTRQEAREAVGRGYLAGPFSMGRVIGEERAYAEGIIRIGVWVDGAETFVQILRFGPDVWDSNLCNPVR